MMYSYQNEDCTEIWRVKLGQKNNKQIKYLISNKITIGVKLDKDPTFITINVKILSYVTIYTPKQAISLIQGI